jgi:hypothetical protein
VIEHTFRKLVPIDEMFADLVHALPQWIFLNLLSKNCFVAPFSPVETFAFRIRIPSVGALLFLENQFPAHLLRVERKRE